MEKMILEGKPEKASKQAMQISRERVLPAEGPVRAGYACTQAGACMAVSVITGASRRPVCLE